jgi:hypothetical protein
MYNNQFPQTIVAFSTNCFNISARIHEYYTKVVSIELIWDTHMGVLVVVSWNYNIFTTYVKKNRICTFVIINLQLDSKL